MKILAFYHFSLIKEPLLEVLSHKVFCSGRDIRGRIYISEQGINAQMSASEKDAEEYIKWISTHPSFQNLHIKQDDYHEHAFAKTIIKYRRQLVALDLEVPLDKRGEHVSPQKWNEMLENEKNRVLIDVRNDYEWKVGYFKDAELPPCNTFREFQHYADKLKEQIDPQKTPVMMYCTGGIRCELFSAFLKQKGFEKVYQLEGGVINYGHKQGSKNWQGKLFVFDDRMTVPISKEETTIIGKCHHCGTSNESYYNCANMDCNYLFLCCKECLTQFQGCCKQECMGSSRLRPYHELNPHKPFRKKGLLQNN